jgi:hypothetical protein
MKKTLSILLLALIANNASGALVSHTGKYFAVTEHDRSYRVGRESLDGTLRNINKTNLSRFMQKGRISTHKLNDGSYMLRGHVNGVGGGPIAGWIAYWGTKALCYGTGIAAASTVVVTTGGLAGVLTGGGVAIASSGASVGAGIAGAALAGGGAVITEGAVTVGVNALAAYGSTAGIVTAIETTASTLGVLAGACPFLP